MATFLNNLFLMSFTNVLKYGLLSQGGLVFPVDCLVSYWRIDETSGTVIYDSKGSINGTLNTGTINNIGISNTCYRNTSSTSDGISFGNNYAWERTNSWSFNIWVKFTTLNTTQLIMNKQKSSKPYYGYYIAVDNTNKLYTQLYGTGQITNRATSATFTNTGVWYMVTLTYNGSSQASGLLLYKNGEVITVNSEGASSISGTMVSTQIFRIGCYFASNLGFLGYMDEAAMFNCTLTPTEVANLYNSGSGLFY